MPARLLACAATLLLAACGTHTPPAYFLSHHPSDTRSRQLRHYPVARQGKLTAWLTSDHVSTSGPWLYTPGDPAPKCRIVGNIRARDMPQGVKHDGAFLVVSGYEGPIFDLWQGTDAEGKLFTSSGSWIPVRLHQAEAVNTRVKAPQKIGGWSGFPLVIGDPDHPDAIAGAMWYRNNIKPTFGGATSTRLLKRWLGKLRLADFVTNPARS